MLRLFPVVSHSLVNAARIVIVTTWEWSIIPALDSVAGSLQYSGMKTNRIYYDDFAASYEDHRHHGYHALIDRLQLDMVLPYCRYARVLEVGCGTGLLLKETAQQAKEAIGLDISPGMLAVAQSRGLNVIEGDATSLPFEDGQFDLVYSFKVLAHVASIERALTEIGRVLAPGGLAILDFYNRTSMRYLLKRIKKPTPIGQSSNDEDVFTRYDSLSDIRGYFPAMMEIERVAGVRTFTPAAFVHSVPVISSMFGRLEAYAARSPVLGRIGGFMVVRARRI